MLAFAEEPVKPQPPPPEEPAEEIDLLGLPKPRTRTKNDILKLFDKKEEKDLLAEDVFGGGFLVDVNENNQGTEAAAAFPTMAPAEHAAVPQPYYGEQQQLDGFAHQEPIVSDSLSNQTQPISAPVPAYPEITSPVYVQSEPIAIPGHSAPERQDDDFDAFSSRFESVGREDTLMVDNDPFDPFSAGGSAKGSSGKEADSLAPFLRTVMT